MPPTLRSNSMVAATSPLVVGYPRTGFTLLVSVLNEIPQASTVPGTGDVLIQSFCDGAGAQIAARIEKVFSARGLGDDLLYNGNFRQLTGGPKWLKQDAPETACFRKYIGLRGGGDFTLITSHPRVVLDYYNTIHSHVAPSLWAGHPSYAGHRRFSSIRHPAGTLTSACFSLNALASEYIQKFVPASADTEFTRQQLALYKLTDLNFFEALLGPYKAYLEEFAQVADRYVTMRWEDLISDPIVTILGLAEAMGLPLQPAQAATIWRKLDHVNLTGTHMHNLRYGHGVVGGWRHWLTNVHLDMMCDYGLEPFARQYGYDLAERLDEGNYTAFQRRVAAAIGGGTIIREYDDDDLFGFAFNKSNLNLDRFNFKRYAWRTHTQVERSTCTDDDLVMAVWDVAEAACEIFNGALDVLPEVEARHDQEYAGALADRAASLFDDENVWRQWREGICRAATGVVPSGDKAPKLLQAIGTTNIVQFNGQYYGIPQALGTIDFFGAGVSGKAGVVIREELSDLLQILESAAP